MRSRSRFFRRIAAALMVSTSLTLAAVSLSSRAEAAADPVETFLTSKYTYCDAKLVAGVWKISIGEAKATIGQKIQNGIESNIPLILRDARNAGIACEWADTPHNYNDAEKLAKLWGYADPAEAKAKIAYLYTQGESAVVLEALGQAPASTEVPSNEAQLNAFFDSPYTYCDAKLVGALWSIDITQAKAEIGQKILGGYPENIPLILADARKQAQCDFADTGLGYEDAEKLARIWAVSTDEAKTKVAGYYTNGESRVVLEALGAAAQTPAEPGPTPIITVPKKEDGPAKQEN
jgi:hypothetical protein